MDDLIKNKIFGDTIGHINVIEFQKRGLPHAHILLILNNNCKLDPDRIDNIVSAELPDNIKHPKAYETITKCMMHGPCGKDFPNAPCMKANKLGDGFSCSKGYPRNFNEETTTNTNGLNLMFFPIHYLSLLYTIYI